MTIDILGDITIHDSKVSFVLPINKVLITFNEDSINESCSSHASIIVFLTSCGVHVDKYTIIVKHVT